ncbi:MAG: response regulator [Chitinophagaceae bacterium]
MPVDIQLILLIRHDLYRIGLQEILNECSCGQLNVVTATGVASVALQSFAANPESVIIINAKLAEESGIEVTKRIVAHDKEARIIVMTDTKISERYAVGLKSMGIRGCLHEDMEPNDFVEAIIKVYEGEILFPL